MSKWKIETKSNSSKERNTGDKLSNSKISTRKRSSKSKSTQKKKTVTTKVKGKNNYAFIDSQNLNIGTLKTGWQLDYKKFRQYLEDELNVSKAFLFIGYMEEHDSLYKYLEESGYKVVYKKVLEIESDGDTTVKGNVDAEMVLHAALELDNYDCAVVVTGDGDFYALIEYLEKVDKLEKIVVPNHYYSSLFQKYESYILDIGKKRKELK